MPSDTQIAAGSIGDKRFYAKWTVNKYKITFNKNGGTGKMTALKNRNYDVWYELPAAKFKKKGFAIVGWNTEPDGSGVSFRNRDCVKNLAIENGETVVLYAQWEPAGYAITYRLNGGENAAENPAYYKGNMPVMLYSPIKKGYTFDGWYSDSKFKRHLTEIQAGSKGNKTVYAKWVKNTYSIRFDGNPTGVIEGNMPNDAVELSGRMNDVLNVKTGNKITLKKNGFTYKGYTFHSWNTEPDGSGKTYKDKASVKDVVSDGIVTLYAQWVETKYTISYDLKKGKNDPNNPKTYTVNSDEIELEEPTRNGYTFDGWYTTSKYKRGTDIYVIPAGRIGNLKLYAKWKKDK